MNFQAIPVLRIFDLEKAKAFYLDYLGMQVLWEHRFAPELPIYLAVQKNDLVLHLSEHSGDCSPGAKVFVNVSDVNALFEELEARTYPSCSPKLEIAAWGDLSFTVVDPFSNRLIFNQAASS